MAIVQKHSMKKCTDLAQLQHEKLHCFKLISDCIICIFKYKLSSVKQIENVSACILIRMVVFDYRCVNFYFCLIFIVDYGTIVFNYRLPIIYFYEQLYSTTPSMYLTIDLKTCTQKMTFWIFFEDFNTLKYVLMHILEFLDEEEGFSWAIEITNNEFIICTLNYIYYSWILHLKIDPLAIICFASIA